METLVLCACGHSIAAHNSGGCADRSARCVCESDRYNALEAAIDSVRTVPIYLGSFPRWQSRPLIAVPRPDDCVTWNLYQVTETGMANRPLLRYASVTMLEAGFAGRLQPPQSEREAIRCSIGDRLSIRPLHLATVVTPCASEILLESTPRAHLFARKYSRPRSAAAVMFDPQTTF
jgi:hypothetical protein